MKVYKVGGWCREWKVPNTYRNLPDNVDLSPMYKVVERYYFTETKRSPYKRMGFNTKVLLVLSYVS